MSTDIEVRVGQVWKDNDKRSYGRRVRVVEVGETHATVELAATRGVGDEKAKPGRRTQIRLDRFRPTSTGYALVEDVPGPPAPEADVRPVWLLDVDGVLNANKPGWGGPPRKRDVFSALGQREFTIRWAPALMARIRDLHRGGGVEIRWSTTWCGDTEGLERALCLPSFPSEFEVPPHRYVAELKLAAARKVLADGRRLIWTDDMEVPEPDEFLHQELTAGGRALLIRPDGRYGLQPADLDAIEAFIATPAAAEFDLSVLMYGTPQQLAFAADIADPAVDVHGYPGWPTPTAFLNGRKVTDKVLGFIVQGIAEWAFESQASTDRVPVRLTPLGEAWLADRRRRDAERRAARAAKRGAR